MAASSFTSLDSGTNCQAQRDPRALETDHVNGNIQNNGRASGSYPATTSPTSSLTSSRHDPNYSRAAISLRAFLLGATFSASTLTTFYCALFTPLWRLPFFLSTISLFHFLEYYITALYNPDAATVSAFLLSQNGKAYNIAHGMAFLECGIHWWLFPDHYILPISTDYIPTWLGLGFAFLLIGQAVRTTAMAHAGSNFSHLVQSQKKSGHELVTGRIYSWLRHPSYFGFFWWGIGTQIILGNVICLVGYALVLWRFFSTRVQSE